MNEALFNIFEIMVIILSFICLGSIVTSVIVYLKYNQIIGSMKYHMQNDSIHLDFLFRNHLINHLEDKSYMHVSDNERILIRQHMKNSDMHVTSDDKKSWSGKQNALTQSQIEAINKVRAGQPVQYLSYERTMSQLDAFIKLSFHKKWVQEILPSLTDVERDSITKLSPTDKSYSSFITSIFIDICVSMPFYLKKSACYYFGIELENFEDTENVNNNTLFKYILERISSIMNSTILDLGKKIELSGKPNSSALDVHIDARNKLNELMFGDGKVDDIKSPDGTPVEIQ